MSNRVRKFESELAAVKKKSLRLMNMFADCGLGAIYVDHENRVLNCNSVCNELLQINGNITGKPLESVAPVLCQEKSNGMHERFNFDENLSIGNNMIIFRKEIFKGLHNNSKIEQRLTARYKFKDIIYESSVMDQIIEKCKKIADSDSSVMIYGETGTGKEILSQSIHNESPRSNGPFLAINCAAIPDTLLESLLFGTEAGAYTGSESRAGLFEQANHGTLLLDEIQSMNITLQSKLLRVLQEGKVRRVGGLNEIEVDLRVISNINIKPDRAIDEGLLRRDLFYRLGVVNITIPPLRDRKADIPLLTRKIIENYNVKLTKNINDIDAATIEIFMLYDWPGNIRELQHAIEHAMNIIPESDRLISPEYLPDHILKEVGINFDSGDVLEELHGLDNIIQNVETRTIISTLKETSGNISKAAHLLGISRQTLQYRILKNNIDYKTFKK